MKTSPADELHVEAAEGQSSKQTVHLQGLQGFITREKPTEHIRITSHTKQTEQMVQHTETSFHTKVGEFWSGQKDSGIGQ